MLTKLERLRDIVWGEDIPSPTVPEYREHHESIQKILKVIDGYIDELENSKSAEDTASDSVSTLSLRNVSNSLVLENTGNRRIILNLDSGPMYLKPKDVLVLK